ncbi:MULTISPECIES: I78 family peptidase inhibitor [Streptomyces]|uniref:Proteinase inhibitor I78 n=1 Tax=Streptomyces montanisoli TaxID=2798581 RepID=A0A940MAL7_9ACTN|nr:MULTISPECIES: I78 family peptidase inhibitor [Streptomyces]MBP0457789.1 proteinase inhibitor I78 [Streptomyces montanisoli]
MAPTPRPQQGPDDATEAYVGLDAESAERRAREHGWTTVRALPPGSVVTLEFREGRLNFEVDDGSVVRCWRG